MLNTGKERTSKDPARLNIGKERTSKDPAMLNTGTLAEGGTFQGQKDSLIIETW